MAIPTNGNDSLDGTNGDDSIVGFAGNDTLNGLDGADTLVGGGGNDGLDGGFGANLLVGGAGNDSLTAGPSPSPPPYPHDTLIGGAGDDYYNLAHSGGEGTIIERADGGRDRIYLTTSYDFTVPLHVEELIAVIGGSDGVPGAVISGNGQDNIIGVGNASGALCLVLGFGGDDQLSVHDDTSRILGGAGNDTISTDSSNDTLAGGAGDDIIIADAGRDRLSGGAGNDRLTGGAGADLFIFLASTEGADTITDFSAHEDRIALSSTGFGQGWIARAPLDAALFEANAAGAATDADTRLIYETDTGALWFDADGSGAGSARVLLATLESKPFTPPEIKPALTAADIVVIG